MNILLINAGKKDINTKPPLGLMTIGTICKQAGYEVCIIDMVKNDYDSIIADVLYRHDVIGLTAMTTTISDAIDFAKGLKQQYPDKPIIIGGVHASIFPEALATLGCFDAVAVGEGENLIIELLKDINKKQLKRIYKSDVIPEIPRIDYSLININDYKPRYPHAKRTPWVTVQLSRGCPYNCTFCCNIFGKKHRYIPLGEAIGMIGELGYEYGVKDITFYDDEFTLNRNYVLELCEGINRMKLDIEWTCEARVNLVDVQLLTAMKKAGCRLIYFGIESGNQGILDNLRKGTTLLQARMAVKIAHYAGIEAAGYFMLGCPDETKETMKDTIGFAQEIGLDHAQFSICMPIPGSELYSQYNTANVEWNDYQYLGGSGSKVTCTSKLSREEVEAAVDTANTAFAERTKTHG